MSDEKPQPFTLGWWLLMHRYAAWTNERSFQNHFELTEDRFEKLTLWIERRIVRNFARRNRPQPSAPGSWRRAAGVLEGVIEHGQDGQWRNIADGDAAAK